MLDLAMCFRFLQNKDVPKSYQHVKHFSTMARMFFIASHGFSAKMRASLASEERKSQGKKKGRLAARGVFLRQMKGVGIHYAKLRSLGSWKGK